MQMSLRLQQVITAQIWAGRSVSDICASVRRSARKVEQADSELVAEICAFARYAAQRRAQVLQGAQRSGRT
jgi:hypothetical protein